MYLVPIICLSLTMAACASWAEPNSTSATPVGRPPSVMMWTLGGGGEGLFR
jgi:hypothetical protein